MEGKPSITIEYPTNQLRVIDSIEYKPFIYLNIISLTFPKILNIYYNLNPKNPKSCEIIFCNVGARSAITPMFIIY